MSLTFYTGSGSPMGWKAWLALEHKGVPYTLRMLSFQGREHKTPEFLAINPRGKVPALTDGEFALYESGAIVEYLEDQFPEHPLLPRDAQGRALARRITAENELYFYEKARVLLVPLFNRVPIEEAVRGPAVEALQAEAERIEGMIAGEFFLGDGPTAVDYSVYPVCALLRRLESRLPGQGLGDRFPEGLTEWMRHVEALPYFERTWPPHWR